MKPKKMLNGTQNKLKYRFVTIESKNKPYPIVRHFKKFFAVITLKTLHEKF